MDAKKPKQLKTKKDGTKLFDADKSLQYKVGLENLDDLIPDNVVANAQYQVNASAAEFEAHLNEEMAKVGKLYEQFKENPNANDAVFKELEASVLNIKSNAGMFNYQLATLLAWTLYNTIASIADGLDDKKDAIAQGLIRALNVVFQKRMTGDGGASGKALIEEVSQFIEATKSK